MARSMAWIAMKSAIRPPKSLMGKGCSPAEADASVGLLEAQ